MAQKGLKNTAKAADTAVLIFKMERIQKISSDRGNYILVFRLEEVKTLRIPAYNNFVLHPGSYIYCGSAHGNGGLNSRITRHLKKKPKKFWHIDYIKNSMQMLEIWYQISLKKNECAFCHFLHKEMGGEIPYKGFGSSDCVKKCDSHLIMFPKEENRTRIFEEIARQFAGLVRIFPHHFL